VAEERPASPPSTAWKDRFAAAIGAWQPITGRGVAAFADASLARALVFHLIAVVLSSGMAGWTLYRTWVPAIDRAVEHLPESGGQIRFGRFSWPGTDSQILGETPQFGVAVNPSGRSAPGQVADLQLELLPDELHVAGLAGHIALPYPDSLQIALDRVGGRAGWQAWNWVIVLAVVVSLLLAFWVMGWILAMLLMVPVWIISHLANRHLTLVGAGQICLVAWIPGALFLNLGMWGYSWNWLRLTGFVGCFIGLHLIWLTWIAWAVAARPAQVRAEPRNPFRP
jgi:hypothetical protein